MCKIIHLKVSPYAEPFFLVCNLALVSGPVSYLLIDYQLFFFDP